METRSYADGDLILAQGEISDLVYHVQSGEVEVFVSQGGREVILGKVGEGEFLGEMGVIGGHNARSASARAKGAVTAELLDCEEFLGRVSRDQDLAYRLIQRMSERLRNVNNRLAESIAWTDSAQNTTITLLTDHDAIGAHLPRDGLVVDGLPFVIGRLANTAGAKPNLALPDERPYHLSRMHFSLDQSGEDYIVRDLDSTLGTEVNGDPIGAHFTRDFARLQPGQNVVVAGGHSSPFRFRVLLEGTG